MTSWTCFHCGETFTDEGAARDHFGANEDREAACRIKVGAEGSMLKALRRAEDDAQRAWDAIHSETTDAAKAHYAQGARHREQVQAAEELGYERGLAAINATRDLLADALATIREETSALVECSIKLTVSATGETLPIPGTVDASALSFLERQLALIRSVEGNIGRPVDHPEPQWFDDLLEGKWALAPQQEGR